MMLGEVSIHTKKESISTLLSLFFYNITGSLMKDMR